MPSPMPPLPTKPNHRGELITITPTVQASLTRARRALNEGYSGATINEIGMAIYPKMTHNAQSTNAYCRRLIKAGWLEWGDRFETVAITEKGLRDLKNAELMHGEK